MKSATSFFTKDLRLKERGRLHEHGGGAYPARSIATCTTKIWRRFAMTFDDLYLVRLTSALRPPVCGESSRKHGRCPQLGSLAERRVVPPAIKAIKAVEG